MPRMARVVMPKYPHSVVQRGHNRQVVFAEPADFEYHLDTRAESKAEYAVHMCGFCLMTNHVHFVLQPGERVVGLCQLMKGLPHQQQGRPRMASENNSVPFFSFSLNSLLTHGQSPYLSRERSSPSPISAVSIRSTVAPPKGR